MTKPTKASTYKHLLNVLCCSRCGTSGKCKCTSRKVLRKVTKPTFHEWQTDVIGLLAGPPRTDGPIIKALLTKFNSGKKKP